jgi:acyl carrier protein phosphodiesterase
MNYLSLSLLAGPSEDKIFGSFLGNNIKVNSYHKYNEETLDGVRLNKRIDDFTNSHPSFQKSIERLSPKFRKYGKPLIRLFYDHFLAANWNKYSKRPLKEHASYIYEVLSNRSAILPYKAGKIFPMMIKTDWLHSQAELKGTFLCMKDLIRLTILQSTQENAFTELMENYQQFREDFEAFFPDLCRFVKEQDLETGRFVIHELVA